MAAEPLTRPAFARGALRVYESQQPGAPSTTIQFSYNPETVKRAIVLRTPPPDQQAKRGAAVQDTLRSFGPPVETITLTILLDATDALDAAGPESDVVQHGLHPQLAVLELLLHPSRAQQRETNQAAQQGEVQVSQTDLPLVLLIWGDSRTVPVFIQTFSVSEEQFDTKLNPIRARVDLALKVLTTVELPPGTTGADAYTSYLQAKERLAQSAATPSV